VAGQPAPCLDSENPKQNETEEAGGTESRDVNQPGEELEGEVAALLSSVFLMS